MTERQLSDTLDEMEEYFVRCFASAAMGSRQESRFMQYIHALRAVKEKLKPGKPAENKEANP